MCVCVSVVCVCFSERYTNQDIEQEAFSWYLSRRMRKGWFRNIEFHSPIKHPSRGKKTLILIIRFFAVISKDGKYYASTWKQKTVWSPDGGRLLTLTGFLKFLQRNAMAYIPLDFVGTNETVGRKFGQHMPLYWTGLRPGVLLQFQQQSREF